MVVVFAVEVVAVGQVLVQLGSMGISKPAHMLVAFLDPTSSYPSLAEWLLDWHLVSSLSDLSASEIKHSSKVDLDSATLSYARH